jgi:hypothetical protein
LNNSIRNAIRDKKLIEFDYEGHHRIAEPHVHGISNEQYEAQTFQIGGGSNSGGIPDWRRIKVDQITNLRVTEQRFEGRRPFPSGKHSPFDTTYDVVDP